MDRDAFLGALGPRGYAWFFDHWCPVYLFILAVMLAIFSAILAQRHQGPRHTSFLTWQGFSLLALLPCAAAVLVALSPDSLLRLSGASSLFELSPQGVTLVIQTLRTVYMLDILGFLAVLTAFALACADFLRGLPYSSIGPLPRIQISSGPQRAGGEVDVAGGSAEIASPLRDDESAPGAAILAVKKPERDDTSGASPGPVPLGTEVWELLADTKHTLRFNGKVWSPGRGAQPLSADKVYFSKDGRSVWTEGGPGSGSGRDQLIAHLSTGGVWEVGPGRPEAEGEDALAQGGSEPPGQQTVLGDGGCLTVADVVFTFCTRRQATEG